MPIVMTDYTKQIKLIECKGVVLDEFYDGEFDKFNSTPDPEYYFDDKVAFKRANDHIFWKKASNSNNEPFDLTMWVVSSANRYYTIVNDSGTLFLSRLAYHDDRDPYPKEFWKTYPYREDYRKEDEENGYDKNLIDEFWAIINIENKTYSLGSHRHVLCGGSGHGSIGRITPEKVNSWKPKEGEDEIKAILMVAQATIDELRVIEGIEVITALDFGLLDIIPSPDGFKEKRKRPSPKN